MQSLINVDGSTVIQIKYKRNVTSIILDLDGGNTATTLKDGEGGKKLLEGKFEAKVEVVGLEKEGYSFEKWEPELPKTFPKDNDSQIYVAKWKRDNVSITVKGDAGVEVSSPNIVRVAKNAKWANVKAQVMSMARPKKDFELIEWHLNSEDGDIIEENKEFNENATVFVKSRQIRKARYKVEHYQQNLENEEYKKVETEEKEGVVGNNTEAEAKIYAGFTALGFRQKEIKANGLTVIRIRYERNIVSLIIDLKGGETSTQLENGNNGTKLLKGKFEEDVYIKAPTKQGVQFNGWEPELPTNFPANDKTIYVAKWGAKTLYRINIEGDERVEVLAPEYIDVPIGENKTFGEVREEIEKNVKLKAEWSSEDYCIYDWRIGEEEGEELLDSSPITGDMVVYARTNYKRFHIYGTELYGYNGEKPRGRIILSKELTEIGNDVFQSCENLTRIDLSQCTEVSSIGSNAFSGCANLESIDLSQCSKLKKIEESTFSGCSKLASVNLSGCSEIASIENDAFNWCSNLESIDLSPCTKLSSIGNQVFYKCTKLKSVDISDCSEIASIGSGAFSGCESLGSIDLSPCTKLKTIGESTFSGCSKLASVNLSGCSELTSIAGGSYYYSAFKDCANLESIDLSQCSKLKKIEAYTFSGCSKLASINLSGCSEIASIENDAFYGCTALETIDLSPCTKLSSIGNQVFYQCTKLKSVDISDCTELTSIGSYAFYECKALASIDLSPCTKLKKIESSTFNGCIKLASVNLSGCSEIASIEEYAFSRCEILENIDLSPCTKLSSIRQNTFDGCSKLASVNLSGCSELTSIAGGSYYYSAFKDCANLESIDLSQCSKLKKIESSTFNGCTKAIVKLPSSITEIKNGAFGYTSSYCRRVLVPNNEIKVLVGNSGYPLGLIQLY